MKALYNKLNRKKPTSLREALEGCLLSDSERGKEYVYKKLYGYVMAVTLRYLRNEYEAEEVVNECFIKAFEKLGTFVQHEEDAVLEKTFRSWLARIAVNSCIDFLRKKKLDASTPVDELTGSDLQKHVVYNAQELEQNDILALLEKLSDVQRTIFNLYEIEGYTHEEISERLRIPESTSRTYLMRAKRRLRELYENLFYQEKGKTMVVKIKNK